MQGYYAVISAGFTDCWSRLYAFEAINVPKKVFRSRGPASENGSGPYFRALKRPSNLTIAGSSYSTDLMYRWNVPGNNYPNFAAGTASYGGPVYFLDARGQSNPRSKVLSVYKHFLVRFPGNHKVTYVQETYQMAKASFNLPTTLDGWIASFDRICSRIVEQGTITYRHEFTDSLRLGEILFIEPDIRYELGELNAFNEISDLQIFPKGFATGFSTAYVNAVADLDLTSVNTLQNIRECIEGLIAVVNLLRNPVEGWRKFYENFFLKYEVRNFKKIRKPGEISQLWLKYRYQYGTTKLDVQEYTELVTRLRHLKLLLEKDIHATGHFSSVYGSFRAELRIAVSDIYPSDVGDWLSAVGIEPNAANIWDMIPYSFIADWFFHIDELMSYVDRIGNSISFPVKSIWFTYMSEYSEQHVFFRVPGRRLNVLPTYVEKEASSKTIKMRIADFVSLILGR